MKTIRRPAAFTLIELLVVISILGILAALTVPALKNIGKSNAQTSAARQLMDDIGRARQYAINNHSPVYMIFVPTNFANVTFLNRLAAITVTSDRNLALITATNLIAGQSTAYNFVSFGKLGDQPGRHAWHYLDPWHYLPDGTMIHPGKFQPTTAIPMRGPPQWLADYNLPSSTIIPSFPNATLVALNTIPFPTDASPVLGNVLVPYLIFNYLGQLSLDGTTLSTRSDEYIPLMQGYINYPINPATKTPIYSATASTVTEVPPGNSTNISYNIIHITALTGRVGLEYYSVK